MPAERGSQRCTIRSVAGVSIEHDDGETRYRSGSGEKPRAEPQPVRGVELDRLAIGETSVAERGQIRKRKVDQSPLRYPDESYKRNDDGD